MVYIQENVILGFLGGVGGGGTDIGGGNGGVVGKGRGEEGGAEFLGEILIHLRWILEEEPSEL